MISCSVSDIMASRRQPSLLPDGITQKGVDVLVITIVVMFLASISVLLRFMQRRRASVKYDDWTCLASLLVGYCFTISTVLLATIGKAGNHIYQFQNDPEKTTLFIQVSEIFPHPMFLKVDCGASHPDSCI